MTSKLSIPVVSHLAGAALFSEPMLLLFSFFFLPSYEPVLSGLQSQRGSGEVSFLVCCGCGR